MRYFLDPFGCVKNQVDAENMMAFLNKSGWSSAADAGDADLIIVNSCGFIESAKRESINAVLGWRKLYPGKKILLAGCLAQRYAKELAESLPEADGLFGIDDVSGIVEKVKNFTTEYCCPTDSLEFHGESEEKILKLRAVPRDSIPPWFNILPATRPLLSLPGSAYVKISEGCNNNCSFCAIPLIRGPLRCRTVPDILDECRGLLARGIRELCVIGQDIGSYRSDGSGLAELLNAVSEIQGDFWVRLLYIHPDHFPLQILDIIERDKRFLPYFDIPFQHSSPNILPAMNRLGTVESYIALADTIRKRLPDAVIRTTFLTGFPGETESDFASLLDFQMRLNADWLGCFSFSLEEGTPAYSMKKKVPRKTAGLRKREIEERQIQITEKNMDRFAGRELDVLLEERFDNGAGAEEESAGEILWLGRLYCHAPEVDGAAVVVGGNRETGLKAGDIVPCRVIARRGIDLEVGFF